MKALTQHQLWNKDDIVIDIQAELVQHLTDVNQAPKDDASLKAEFKAQVCSYFVNDFLLHLTGADS
ncbi:hypothetical protein NVP1076O_11 [Vibrio phage 1.076.O._10N.286.51.B7]|nr:hypothetical protein NVP1076O_11 [Vibrio phage 1.076.O._10N.286.51.B7]